MLQLHGVRFPRFRRAQRATAAVRLLRLARGNAGRSHLQLVVSSAQPGRTPEPAQGPQSTAMARGVAGLDTTVDAT